MKLIEFGKPALVSTLLLFSLGIHATVVEDGDLNIINDPGNPSDGLRFLDMAYSDGLSHADALGYAQSVYANARLATPTEFDDLFVAADINYNGAMKASDGFEVGAYESISDTINYDGGQLRSQLGLTTSQDTFIWTDPDGIRIAATTRDFLVLSSVRVTISQTSAAPPNASIGWLLVSEPSAVPVPAAGWLFMSALLGLVGKKRLCRR